MKRTIGILSILLIMVSCAQEVVDPAQQITGNYALDDGSGLTNEYLAFNGGKLSFYCSDEKFPLAENKIWNNGKGAFALSRTEMYSIQDNLLHYNGFTSTIATDQDGIRIGKTFYVRLDGFTESPYSKIQVEKNSYIFPLQENIYSLPVTILNPINAGRSSFSCSESWITNISFAEGQLSFKLLSTNKSRSGHITLKYTCADDLQLSIGQEASTFIRIEESKTIDYNEGRLEIPYTIENPVEGSELTMTYDADWIQNIKVTSSKLELDVLKNSSYYGRSTKLFLSYDGAQDVILWLNQTGFPVSIVLDKYSFTLYTGEKESISATRTPSDAPGYISWSSSNSSVASVSSSGVVTGKTAGHATITAKDSNGVKATCEVEVKQPVTSISLNKTALSLLVGDEYQLIATVLPSLASDKTVQWSSNNTEVATVDSETGLVKAIKEGDAKIVAYAGGLTATCSVHVDFIPVQSITLNKTSITLYEGEEYSLVASIIPENATYKDITWSSGNNGIATVEEGKVLAVKKGKTTITAMAKGKSASCSVEVLSSMAGISLNKASLSLIVGNSETLQAIITPSDATLRESIRWESSNEDVATVDSNGKVVAVKEGNATITASVEGKKAECRVSVDYIHVSSITLNKTNETLYIGDNLTLTATLYPSGVTYNTVEWVSSNENVARVDQSGIVTAVGKGAAAISAKSGGKEAKCTITVLVPLQSLSFDQSNLSIFKGSTATLSVIKSPSDATLKGSVQWSSSNISVATVSKDGVVTAVKQGTATISASVDGCTARCNVSVMDAVTGISLDKTSATINRGNTLKLNYSVQPTGATLQGDVSWSSSKPEVATVDNVGNVKAVAAGSGRITVSLEGFSASCDITVVVPVSSISLSQSAMDLIKGESKALTATVLPSDATDRDVSWTSSNTSIASVDQSGMVTAHAGGSVTIKASAGGMYATCSVRVIVPVSSVTLNKTNLSLIKGESAKLTATVNPSDATDKSVSWSSSNPSVATIAGGVVEARAGGTAVITVNASGKTATCTVVVTVPVSSVNLNLSSAILKQNETVQLMATIGPDDATDKTVAWSSSDPSVATVDSTGKVKALKEGSATISAMSGTVTATCSITVSNNIGGGHEGTGTETWE